MRRGGRTERLPGVLRHFRHAVMAWPLRRRQSREGRYPARVNPIGLPGLLAATTEPLSRCFSVGFSATLRSGKRPEGVTGAPSGKVRAPVLTRCLRRRCRY